MSENGDRVFIIMILAKSAQLDYYLKYSSIHASFIKQTEKMKRIFSAWSMIYCF